MPLGVYFIQSVYSRELLTLNLFKICFNLPPSISLPWSKYRNFWPLHWQKDRNSKPFPWYLDRNSALHPGHRTGTLRRTPVTGPELGVLLQNGIGTLCSFLDWTRIQSSDPCLNRDSQFRSCDQGKEPKFRSSDQGRELKFRSCDRGRELKFRSCDQGKEREGGKFKNDFKAIFPWIYHFG